MQMIKYKLTRLVSRTVRRLKEIIIVTKIPIVMHIFFWLFGIAEKLLSTNKQVNHIENKEEEKSWQEFYKSLAPFPTIVSDSPLAFSSDDHLHPHGSLYDNSVNKNFNTQCYNLFDYKSDLSLLDLGCSGGGTVKSFIQDGYFACGIEGSDAQSKLGLGEWNNIPNHLYTADITKPFSIKFENSNEKLLFDLITAWEVLEHIDETNLNGLMHNIYNNLNAGGYFIGSIAFFKDGNPITGAVYHKTIKPSKWWIKYFVDFRFEIINDHNFRPEDMVRGNGKGLKEWHPDEGVGMHIVAQK